MSYVDYSTVIRDFAIDFTSLYFLTYVILYRRYRNAELFVSCALFNVFMLVIIMAIIRTNFNIAIGFGLFALLSLVQLRSSQFTKTEMAYLFGSVALAVINGAGITDLNFVLLSNFVIIGSAWIISTWSIEHSARLIEVDNVRKMSLTLDHIDTAAMRDSDAMLADLRDRLGVDVQSYDVNKIDYVRDIIELTLVYQLPVDDSKKTIAALTKTLSPSMHTSARDKA